MQPDVESDEFKATVQRALRRRLGLPPYADLGLHRDAVAAEIESLNPSSTPFFNPLRPSNPRDDEWTIS